MVRLRARFLSLLLGATSSLAWAGPIIIAGTDAGPTAQVRVFDGQTAALLQSFTPYGTFTGGVRVAAADVTGDGVPDIVTGAGSGLSGGHVKVFDGVTGAEVRNFLASPGFAGGVYVAAADVNGDGFADIITGSGSGLTGGQVQIFSGATGALLKSFFAYAGFAGGARVAGGDVNSNGLADILTGPGPGTVGANVKVFDSNAVIQPDGSAAAIQSFFAYTSFNGGVFVAAGDVNGDARSDLVTGAGSGNADGHVKVFDAVTGALLRSFFAFPGFAGGVSVGAADLDGDGLAEMVAGAGPGQFGGWVKVFPSNPVLLPNGAATPLLSFFAFPDLNTGVFVAAASGTSARVVSEPSSLLLLSGAMLLAIGCFARTRRHCSNTDAMQCPPLGEHPHESA